MSTAGRAERAASRAIKALLRRDDVLACQVENEDALNIDAVAKYASNLPGVENVEALGVQPRLNPQLLAEALKRGRIERVVIAGDQPGYFKPIFTRAMALAGQDPTEVRLASFRARRNRSRAP